MTDTLDLLALVKADTLVLRKSHNLLTTEGPDIEVGNGAANTIFGMGGDDVIGGRGGADALFGDAGDDRLYGGRGADRLSGGADDDRLYGGLRSDTFDGGDGADRLYLNGGADRVVYELGDGDEGRDTIFQFTIGKDKVLLDGYTPSASALSLTSTGGNAVVTFTETGQQVVFDGLSFATVRDNITSIFEIV